MVLKTISISPKIFLLINLLFLLYACAPYDLPSTPSVPAILPPPTGAPVDPTVSPKTPTTVATAQPTQTENQLLVSRLSPLPGFAWGATSGDAGEQVVLLDDKKNVVATLDRKIQGIRWDSLKYFNQLNPLLANPEGQKILSAFLGKNKNDIRFITYPAAPDNGKTPPPYAVVLDAKGDVALISGAEGTGDYKWDTEQGMNHLASVYKSKEKTNYSRNNPDGMVLGWYVNGKFEKTYVDEEGKTHFAPGAYILPYLVPDIPYGNPVINDVLQKAKKNPSWAGNMNSVANELVSPPPTDVSDSAWKKFVEIFKINSFSPEDTQMFVNGLLRIDSPFIRAAAITNLKGITYDDGKRHNTGINSVNDNFYVTPEYLDYFRRNREYLFSVMNHDPVHALQHHFGVALGSRSIYVEIQAEFLQLESNLKTGYGVNNLINTIINMSHSKLQSVPPRILPT